MVKVVPDDAEPAGLAVRRQAAIGFGAGAAVAAAVFVFFALIPGTRRPLALYAGLAVVLAFAAGLLVTLVLVGWRVRRLAGQ
ncbi:MAG: hypothetical protein ABEJ92_10200 [Halobacteriales archaeon]